MNVTNERIEEIMFSRMEKAVSDAIRVAAERRITEGIEDNDFERRLLIINESLQQLKINN